MAAPIRVLLSFLLMLRKLPCVYCLLFLAEDREVRILRLEYLVLDLLWRDQFLEEIVLLCRVLRRLPFPQCCLFRRLSVF